MMNMNDVINVVKNAIKQVNEDWKEHIGEELQFRGMYRKNGWIFFDIGKITPDEANSLQSCSPEIFFIFLSGSSHVYVANGNFGVWVVLF